jgi:hypothetical protein
VSPPGKRRGGPFTTDRPTNVASSPTPQQHQRTTARRQPLPAALATVYLVHTTRGGLRALLLVDCPLPGCGHVHQHRAPVDFTSARRKAGCGGSYVVHAGAVEAGCAA